MKNKNNKDLLNEEVNKFRLLSEYAFYEDRGGEEEEAIEDLLLGNMSEEEEDFGNEEGNEKEEEGAGDDDFEFEDEPVDDEESEDSSDEEEASDDDFGFGGEEPSEEPEMAPEEPAEEEVELDVTELVRGSEEAKASADSANQKIDQLMGMMNNLDKQVSSMSTISTKIDSLENELEKRAPTPNEKLEMISLDSAPFNMRLGDFWKDQEGQYDVMSDNKPKEYVLDKKAINADYSDSNIKDTFSSDNEYEEEEF